MTEWTTIQTWPCERFQHYGQMWRRWTPPDGGAPIEAAESAIIGCRASIGYGASIAFGARINVEARIGDGASIGYRAIIGDWARIGDGAIIGDTASIGDGASIGRGDIWRCIGPLGSGGRTLTVTSGANGIWCYTGCFAGTAEEFLAVVESTHGDSALARGYKAALVFAEEQFRLDKETKA